MTLMEQSIRNEIPCTVKEIISDKVLSEIIVETRIGEMAAVITTRSVQDMGLKVGDRVAALVKATKSRTETPEECLARELDEELGILTRTGEKCAERLHRYDHGNFRIVAYLVDCIAGEPRPNVHDQLQRPYS